MLDQFETYTHRMVRRAQELDDAILAIVDHIPGITTEDFPHLIGAEYSHKKIKKALRRLGREMLWIERIRGNQKQNRHYRRALAATDVR